MLASTVQRVAFSGGKGCFQQARRAIEDTRAPLLRSVPAGEGARTTPKSDRKAVEQLNDERRRRNKGIDGAKREGRSKFVNAEIARTAPRREFGTESQSCCERSKERHECFILHDVRYVFKTCTRIVCVGRRTLCLRCVLFLLWSFARNMQHEIALGVDRGMTPM